MVLEMLGNGLGEFNDNNHIRSVLDLEHLKGGMW